MVNSRAKLLFTFLLFFSAASAQNGASIGIQKNCLIRLPFSEYVLGEPHLAINPKNANHLLIGAMMWSPKEPLEISCISAVSFDGGMTWTWHRFSDKNSADPWCVITSKGNAVFSLLGRDSMWTYHSADGGRSWKDSASHGTRHDHETMVIAGGISNDSAIVYLLSVQGTSNKEGARRESLFLARSNNAGRTFDHKINVIQNNLWKNTMTPVVLSDGTLLLSYSEYAYKTADENQVFLTKSHSWTVSSGDSGKTFSEPRFVTDVGDGFPVLEVDNSVKFRDRLYWVASAEKGKQILCFYSTDKGEKWSSSTIVSNSQQVKTIPNIAINNKGIVGITWYEKDTVKYCQNFYFALSTDGGKTFTLPVKVSDRISCADSIKNGRALRGGWSAGGHYTGIVSDEKGDFLVVWADARSGRYQLYKTRITVSPGPAR